MIDNASDDVDVVGTPRPRQQALAYCVHLLTASGIVPAALAMHEIMQPDCDPRVVFLYLLVTTVIDAIDGPLARRFHVKRFAASIDGRTIDDLLDYLTFAFIPLLLVWRMDWLPAGLGWTTTLAMGASLLGFAHRDAKDEANGFFRGFPSYWNIAVFYAGILFQWAGPWSVACLLGCLTVLTVSPIRMIYPNLAPQRHRGWVLIGAALWSLTLLGMTWDYPLPPPWLLGISLIYPVCYAIASCVLSRSVHNTSFKTAPKIQLRANESPFREP
ncbi:CDP-alcohol phosphatidyltransferase family protein [Rhodopirellula halodulae]|uniref:CDP-alcohol phosphatidyltransferase family protein n=1 Tax=Rhodopirellula halodulae TaxID=2894198 RepID=UPI001E45B286|nr:phosphatidylcholine synthase [Rhodopirellula sp. JC737]MCC9658337.1 phosphatidylcholine synthase [Rhodopirellula sp. JC737]